MKVIRKDLPATVRSVELHTISDLHIGDKFCAMDKIRAMIDRIAGTENAYAILNGDLINNATKASVSDFYSEQMTPMDQIELCVKLFEPIKDKIIAINTGNHEVRTWRADGVDITKIVASQLGLSDVCSAASSLIFLRFGRQGAHEHHRPIRYTIHCTHGSGGGRKEGAKAIRLADMAAVVDADVYIHGHTHLPMIMKQAFYRTSEPTSSVYKVDKLFVNTAAQLEYGGYGEMFEFKPSSTDTPVIYLDGEKKRATAKL